MPASLGDRLERLEDRLADEGLLLADDTADLVDRLQVTMQGLDVRPQRPSAVLLLMGSAASAADTTSRAIAEELFGGPDRIVELDLGHMNDTDDLNTLVGPPPGYIGFEERRGPNTFQTSYPLDAHQTGIYYQQARFSRNMYTTGIVLHHPDLQGDAPRGQLAELILDAFRLTVPFESRDIGVTTDKLRVERPGLPKGDHVIVIYDQTYGSLRLSSRLLGDGILARVLLTAVTLAAHDLHATPHDEDLPQVCRTLQRLAHDAAQSAQTPAWAAAAPPPTDAERVQVLLPGTTGICLLHDHREMQITQVYYSPRAGLQYKGRLSTDNAWDTHLTVVPVGGVQAIPGVSALGWYDLDLGEIVPGETGE